MPSAVKAPNPVEGAARRHTETLDRNYRFQRHIYDLTRKPYLFGRDRLLRTLNPAPGERVLEVGCGTARNLRLLARMQPAAQYFGLDASQAMLETAERALAGTPEGGRIQLRRAMAESFVAAELFDGAEPLDAIFFSYALTMIPPWREALENAWAQLRPGGRLLAVDFWDAGGLPRWCGKALHGWLGRFHTHPVPEMPETVAALAPGSQIQPVGPRYAFLVECRKA